MCFRLGSCFNGGITEDDYGRRPSTPKGPDQSRSTAAYRGNGRKGAAATYGHMPAAVGEAGRKAYYDVPKDAHGYAAHAQVRAYGGYAYPAADEASKLTARNNKVGDDHAGYRTRLHEAADRENAMDYHTGTTTVER